MNKAILPKPDSQWERISILHDTGWTIGFSSHEEANNYCRYAFTAWKVTYYFKDGTTSPTYIRKWNTIPNDYEWTTE